MSRGSKEEIFGERIFRGLCSFFGKTTFNTEVTFKKKVTGYAPVPGEPALGEPHQHPNNTTTYAIMNGGAVPAAGAWTAAQNPVTSGYATPGTKAIKPAVILRGLATANGRVYVDGCFTLDNTTIPTWATSHPYHRCDSYQLAGGDVSECTELEIPLNSSGAFYFYCITRVNITTPLIDVAVKGTVM